MESYVLMNGDEKKLRKLFSNCPSSSPRSCIFMLPTGVSFHTLQKSRFSFGLSHGNLV
jgi:hypothetical protein